MANLAQMRVVLGLPPPVLLIACGDKKEAGPIEAYRLYKGPIWQTYRKWRGPNGCGIPQGAPNPYVEVLVVSAKHGLVPELDLLTRYNTRLTTTNLTPVTALFRASLHRLQGRSITFSGSAIYARALRAAGYSFTPLSFSAGPDCPGGGIGCGRKRLRLWLEEQSSC